MQSPPTDSYSLPPVGPTATDEVIPPQGQTAEPLPHEDKNLVLQGQYAGQMEMAASVDNVGEYLNQHRGWFPRCASPMQVSPISDHGYALLVGHFSILGYEVEPKVGLYLAPLDQRIYRIDTIPVPDYEYPGYDVDFKAVLELKDQEKNETNLSPMTLVDWQLSLNVKIHIPRFMNALPHALVKSSGDRLLNQVVRQVSKRLTRKVQEEFHTTQGLSLPESYHRHHFWSNWGKPHH